MIGGIGGRSSQASMLKQLQTLQEDMLRAQEEVAAMTVTTSAGGGVVKAVIGGNRRVQSLTIAREAVDPDDVEMLQDLIIAAINEGLERIEQSAAERMRALTGGLDLSTLF